MIDSAALIRSQILVETVDPAVYRENMRRALSGYFEDAETGVKKTVWPRAKVRILYCDMDVGDGVWAAQLFERQAEENRKNQKGRDVEVVTVEKANHFVHWDEPERFARLLAKIA
ncbi:hypothetical protein SERLA73DRAFT_178600 [Serpula lacrymans var. lacrymans S7.3]|uniref:AB hydrolase-1 domain-containing protein n=1 Tax=Serpula lacrymans var. lacrymans (strain S7.3) TaxID=936435 RepID=F8PS93_SERL3|nr:hypothetical protein SERLA73DRAFT_178600 [Serpula lacrymans var. lacrymans S7.3]